MAQKARGKANGRLSFCPPPPKKMQVQDGKQGFSRRCSGLSCIQVRTILDGQSPYPWDSGGGGCAPQIVVWVEDVGWGLEESLFHLLALCQSSDVTMPYSTQDLLSLAPSAVPGDKAPFAVLLSESSLRCAAPRPQQSRLSAQSIQIRSRFAIAR